MIAKRIACIAIGGIVMFTFTACGGSNIECAEQGNGIGSVFATKTAEAKGSSGGGGSRGGSGSSSSSGSSGGSKGGSLGSGSKGSGSGSKSSSGKSGFKAPKVKSHSDEEVQGSEQYQRSGGGEQDCED